MFTISILYTIFELQFTFQYAGTSINIANYKNMK